MNGEDRRKPSQRRCVVVVAAQAEPPFSGRGQRHKSSQLRHLSLGERSPPDIQAQGLAAGAISSFSEGCNDMRLKSVAVFRPIDNQVQVGSPAVATAQRAPDASVFGVIDHGPTFQAEKKIFERASKFPARAGKFYRGQCGVSLFDWQRHATSEQPNDKDRAVRPPLPTPRSDPD